MKESELADIEKIIYNNWTIDYVDDMDDLIEFVLGGEDTLVLDKDTGKISIRRAFQYDSDNQEMDVRDNNEVYCWEKSFYLFLKSHLWYEVSCWYDMIYDLGYPGTDFETYVGVCNEDVSVDLIRDYLNCVQMYDDMIDSLQNAKSYLLRVFLGGRNLDGRVHIYYCDDAFLGISEIEDYYEGQEYFVFRAEQHVYVCDACIYRKIVDFLTECTFTYKVLFVDGNLYFSSGSFGIKIEVYEADPSYLEIEKFMLQTKLKQNIYAVQRMFDRSCIEIIQEKTETELSQDMKLTRDIVAVCTKLLQNSLYREQKENERNDYVRDLLEATGYVVKDQTRTGVSTSQKSAGEADLVIQKDGIAHAFIEALNLKSINSLYICEHIERIFKYDQIGVSANYVICYVNVSNVVDFVNKYTQCIIQKRYRYDVVSLDLNVEFLTIKVSNIRIIKMSFNRNNRITDLYHILVFFG